MNPALDALLHHPAIWRGGDLSSATVPTVSSGHASLDQQLPGGGWPLGAVTEILMDGAGIGELSLLLPTLAQVAEEGRGIVWVAPPHVPYAPALAAAGVTPDMCLVVNPDRKTSADLAWTVEQALRSGACGAVLAWPGAQLDYRSLRRLQLAAEASGALCFLFRPLSVANLPSPAPLRLKLGMADKHLAVSLLKRRGAGESVRLLLAIQSRRWRRLHQAESGRDLPLAGLGLIPSLFNVRPVLPGQRPVPVH